MRALVSRYCRDERGGTAIEYAFIAVVVSTMLIGAFSLLTPALIGVWDTISAVF
ncbi:Flp family type IVb pilin [Maricaulis maris]|uniref:Flp pilus assembly pilin Flp n=1 Tax=Maricaulis maris TaxID=74318 RepID=A0A495DF20_9PROT|nr:Flp family type IVb pilin [Maricaulis maris]RKR00505.1 Flp pilus assembly pilin Flp [Maricaulis maris]